MGIKPYLRWEWRLVVEAARRSADAFSEARNAIIAVVIGAIVVIALLHDDLDKHELLLAVATAVGLLFAIWAWHLFLAPYRICSDLEKQVASLEAKLRPSICITDFAFFDQIGKVTTSAGKRDFGIKQLKIGVHNSGVERVTSCKAYLVAAQRKNQSGGWEPAPIKDPILLEWSTTDEREIVLDGNITRYFDVFTCTSDDYHLRLEITYQYPVSLYRFFNQIGDYRVLVKVAASGHMTQEISLEIHQGDGLCDLTVNRV